MALDRSATFDLDSSSLVRKDAYCDYSKEDLGDCRVQSVLQHTHPSYIDLIVSDDCLPKKGIGGHLKYVPTSALYYIDLGDASDCPILDRVEHTVSKNPTYVDVTAYVDLTSDNWTVNGSQWQSSGEGTSSISQNSDSNRDFSRESDVSSVQSKSKPEVKGTRAGRCAPDSKVAESKKAGKERKPSHHILSQDWEEDTPYEGAGKGPKGHEANSSTGSFLQRRFNVAPDSYTRRRMSLYSRRCSNPLEETSRF
jgi:hypothetical protein